MRHSSLTNLPAKAKITQAPSEKCVPKLYYKARLKKHARREYMQVLCLPDKGGERSLTLSLVGT